MADLAVGSQAAEHTGQLLPVPTFKQCPERNFVDFRMIAETCNTFAADHLQALENLGAVIGSAGFESLAIIYQTDREIALNGPIDDAKLRTYQERRNAIVATMTHARGSVETVAKVCALFKGVLGHLDSIILANEANALTVVKDVAAALATNVTDAKALRATLQGHYITYSGALTALTDRLTSSNNRAYKTLISLDSNRGAPLSFYQGTGADTGLLTESDGAPKVIPKECGILVDAPIDGAKPLLEPHVVILPELDLTGATPFKDIADTCVDFWTQERSGAMTSGNAICAACFESLAITHQRAKGTELEAQLAEPQDVNALQVRRNGVVGVLERTARNGETLGQIGDLFTRAVAFLDETIGEKLEISTTSTVEDVRSVAETDLGEARTLRARLQYHRVEILGLRSAIADRQGAATKRALLMQDALDRPWMASTTLALKEVTAPLPAADEATEIAAFDVDEDLPVGAPFPLPRPPAEEDARSEPPVVTIKRKPPPAPLTLPLSEDVDVDAIPEIIKVAKAGPGTPLQLRMSESKAHMAAKLEAEGRSPPASPTQKRRDGRDASSPLGGLLKAERTPSSPLVVRRAPNTSPTPDDSGAIFTFDQKGDAPLTVVDAKLAEHLVHSSPPSSPGPGDKRGSVHVEHDEILPSDAPVSLVIHQPQQVSEAHLPLQPPTRRRVNVEAQDGTIPVFDITTAGGQNVTDGDQERTRIARCCLPVTCADGLKGISSYFLDGLPGMRKSHDLATLHFQNRLREAHARGLQRETGGGSLIVTPWGRSTLRRIDLSAHGELPAQLRTLAYRVRTAHADGKHQSPKLLVLAGVTKVAETVRAAEMRRKDKGSERPPSPVDEDQGRRPFIRRDVPSFAKALLGGVVHAAQTVRDREKMHGAKVATEPQVPVDTATHKKGGDLPRPPRAVTALVKGLGVAAHTIKTTLERPRKESDAKEGSIGSPQTVARDIEEVPAIVAAKQAPLLKPPEGFDGERKGTITTVEVKKPPVALAGIKGDAERVLQAEQSDAAEKSVDTSRGRRRRKHRPKSYSLTGGGMHGQPPPGWSEVPKQGETFGKTRGFGRSVSDAFSGRGRGGRPRGGLSQRLYSSHFNHLAKRSEPGPKREDGKA